MICPVYYRGAAVLAVQVVLHREYSYLRTAAQLHDTAGILLRKHEKCI